MKPLVLDKNIHPWQKCIHSEHLTVLLGGTSKTRFYKLPAASFSHLELKNKTIQKRRNSSKIFKDYFSKKIEINKNSNVLKILFAQVKSLA